MISISNCLLKFSQLQNGGRYSEETSQVGQTESDISTLSREGRQKNCCHMEAGPRQDSSGLSGAFCHLNYGGHR